MAREVEIHIKCDFCDERRTEGELFWDSEPITIGGRTYLVDACPCVERDLNWSVWGVFQRIKDDSRLSEVKPPRKQTPSGSRPRTLASNGTIPCSFCDRKFRTDRGRNSHEKRSHKTELSIAS